MKFDRALLAFFCLLALLSGVATAQRFGPWSAPVHIGAPVSTAEYADLSPAISKDGLSLYFTRCYPNCTAGIGIHVSQRESLDQPWGEPRFVMAGSDPNLTLDGHRMYFSLGGDIYVTRRHNKRDDFGWQTPENLAAINSPFTEGSAMLFEDETTGITYLYFSSNRPGGSGDMDIYVSTLQSDETWGSPVLVPELSSSAFDNHPVLRRDGLEIFFVSKRCGSLPNNPVTMVPSYDIWTSTRASTSDPWSPPVNIDADPFGVTVCPGMPLVTANVNGYRHDGKASLSFDGTTLYFGAAQRPSNFGVGCPYSGTCFFDLWVTTREKLPAPGADNP